MRPRLFLVLVGMVLAAWPGWAGDGKLALQTGASSCRNQTTNIYVDCGNGTVTDNRTGLVWLKNADCLGEGVDWFTAMEFVAGLGDWPGRLDRDCGLSDGSSPGEWRLPSAWEWERMIADAVELGCVAGVYGGPAITSDSGSSCWQEGPGSSFTGVKSRIYWSSTTNAEMAPFAWFVFLSQGAVGYGAKPFADSVWPVRGGQ